MKHMNYPIDVKPGDKLEIFKPNSSQTFTIEPDPLDSSEPYFEFGGTGSVLKLRDETFNKVYALKIFHPDFRNEKQVSYAASLRELNLHRIPGLSVADRLVISTSNHVGLIEQYSALDYSLLMPWISGYTWQEILIESKNSETKLDLSKEACFILGVKLCMLLKFLEDIHCAHCDMCSNNIMINPHTLSIELIDIEDMYN